MNDAHLFSRDRAIDLSRLSDAERRVLRLLAEGHTAKSIATELGTTPTAVNERLREARRKTGVGSSRELARLLKSQENRHEQIGVARSISPAAGSSASDAEPWRPQMGVFAMTALFLTVAAAGAALMSQAPTAKSDVDPLLGEALTTAPDPAALHSKVRAQPRDAKWAPRMESAVRARLLQIPLIGKGGNILRVTCATDLCEMAGTIIWSAPPPKEYDPKLPESRAINDLQVPPLTDDLTKLGLKSETGLFTGGKGKPDRTVFLLYYSRANAAAGARPFSDPLLGDIFARADPQKVALIPTTERDYVHGQAGNSPATEAELRRLHEQVRAEASDERAANELAAAYKSLHPIKLSKAPLRVLCSQSICEVATMTDMPTPQAAVDATLGEVQGPDLRQRAEAMGLKPLYLWFGNHPSKQRAAYLGYWARAPFATESTRISPSSYPSQ